jgi:hypothetical protein
MLDASTDTIAKHCLETLVERELAIARASDHLERRLSAGPARLAAAEVARCCWRGAEALLRVMPEGGLRQGPQSSIPLEHAIRAVAAVSSELALWMLDRAMRSQDRRLREALDVVDAQAQYAIVRWARPAHMRSHAALRRARSAANSIVLETSP